MKDKFTMAIICIFMVLTLFLSYKVYTLDRAVNAKWQYAQENRKALVEIINFIRSVQVNQK